MTPTVTQEQEEMTMGSYWLLTGRGVQWKTAHLGGKAAIPSRWSQRWVKADEFIHHPITLSFVHLSFIHPFIHSPIQEVSAYTIPGTCHCVVTPWVSKVKSEKKVKSLSLTLCDPMDCSLPGSSVHGIFQARVLGWVAISLSQVIFLQTATSRGIPECFQCLLRELHVL